ncbi:MAG: hypothetical protein AB7G11_06435 [Phycisphaerales bacterium]
MGTVSRAAVQMGIWGAVLLLVSGCGTGGEASGHPARSSPVRPAAGWDHAVDGVAPPRLDASVPEDYAGLHNVVAYSEGLYSGSAPDGEDGFEILRAMGVRTIVSVDGARPDVERAAAMGLRYVHLPIGYNGMSTPRRLELARAVRDLPGPVYIHCHHGKHRSAGAAGAVAVTLNRATPEAMLEKMKVSGTAPAYRGLFACVADARPASAEELASASDEFPASWKPTGLVSAMVEIDSAHDGLRAIEGAGWRTPAEHPDLVVAAEAGRLADLFRTLQDDPESASHGAEFIQTLRREEAEATSLEELLLKIDTAAVAPSVEPGREVVKKELSASLKRLGASCKECHAEHRDNNPTW